MTFSYWQRSALRLPDVECDVAVVGGGICGCATAYWLRRLRPGARIALLEAGALAAGASGRNAGFILQGVGTEYAQDRERHGRDRARRLWRFTLENRELLASQLPAERFSLEPTGSLTGAGSGAEAERLRASAAMLAEDGLEGEYLDAPATDALVEGRGFSGALRVPAGAVVHPARLVRLLADESRAHVLEFHPALGVEAGARVRIETPYRAVLAETAVLALNAYLPQLLPALASVVRPVRAQMLATRPLRSRWLPLPVYSHEGFYYLRQLADGTLLLGGARHLHVDAEVGYLDEITPALQADLGRYLAAHFPQAAGAPVAMRWSGVMGFSPDGLPHVGAVPGVPGAWWAAGFTGHGMAYGFRMGRLLAELATGVPAPEGLDLFEW